jgi:hypothetical protein
MTNWIDYTNIRCTLIIAFLRYRQEAQADALNSRKGQIYPQNKTPDHYHYYLICPPPFLAGFFSNQAFRLESPFFIFSNRFLLVTVTLDPFQGHEGKLVSPATEGWRYILINENIFSVEMTISVSP